MPDKIRDPGFEWFADYYERYEDSEDARLSVHMGQVISLPADSDNLKIHTGYLKDSILYSKPKLGQLYVVVRVDGYVVTARSMTIPRREISFPIDDLVAPSNPLYALRFQPHKEVKFLKEVMETDGSRIPSKKASPKTGKTRPKITVPSARAEVVDSEVRGDVV